MIISGFANISCFTWIKGAVIVVQFPFNAGNGFAGARPVYLAISLLVNLIGENYLLSLLVCTCKSPSYITTWYIAQQSGADQSRTLIIIFSGYIIQSIGQMMIYNI